MPALKTYFVVAGVLVGQVGPRRRQALAVAAPRCKELPSLSSAPLTPQSQTPKEEARTLTKVALLATSVAKLAACRSRCAQTARASARRRARTRSMAQKFKWQLAGAAGRVMLGRRGCHLGRARRSLPTGGGWARACHLTTGDVRREKLPVLRYRVGGLGGCAAKRRQQEPHSNKEPLHLPVKH